MLKIKNASTKTGEPPKMEVFQSMWGMLDLPLKNSNWSFEEQIYKIKETGFSGVLYWLNNNSEDERMCNFLQKNDLKIGITCKPSSMKEISFLAKRASELGILFINAQVQNAFVIDSEAINLLNDFYEVCNNAGVPLFIETHRGTVTQDLLRTIRYIDFVPDLRFTLDLSHYVLAGEIMELSIQIESAFDIILKKSASIHARVSNGEQIQIDIGDGESELVKYYEKWWEKSIRHWLKGSESGDIFPFIVELGPPPYGIVQTGITDCEGGMELSDRWQQALVFKKIAEKIWNQQSGVADIKPG